MVLIPLHTPLYMGPPTDYALKMKPSLASTVFFQLVVTICRFIVLDIWGGLSDSILCLLGYMACADMEIVYVMWYGITAFMSALFGGIMVILVTIERKGELMNFEESFAYNMYGFNVLAAPILAALGAIIAYSIYADFRDTAEQEARRPLVGGGFDNGGYGGGGAYGGGGYGRDPPLPPPPSRQQEFQPFQGEGQRLGDGPR